MLHGNNNVIVELYGAPGVGKTTLADTLVREYGFVRAEASPSRFQYTLLVFRHPCICFFWFRVLLRSATVHKSIALLRFNSAVFLRTFLIAKAAHASKAPHVVLEEGFIQRILSLSEHVYTKEQVLTMLAHSIQSTFVIHVDDRLAEKDRYNDSHIRTKLGPAFFKKWREKLLENERVLTEVLIQKKVPVFSLAEKTFKAVVQKIKNE